MREQMTSFDIHRMVSELQFLVNARCKKTYQPHHEQVVLRLKPKNYPQKDLVIIRGLRLYLSSRDRPMPNQPAPFAMLLRKHLTNARIEEISQIGFDRVIKFVFDAKMGRRELIIECFRNGNLILLDENGIIIKPLTHSKLGGRIIKKGVPYESPKGSINPTTLTKSEFKEILSSSDMDLVKTLAIKTNLGGQQAELLCEKSGINSQKLSKEITTNEEFEKIFTELSHLLENLNKNSGGFLFLKSEDVNKTQNEINEAEDLSSRDDLFSELTFESSPIKISDKENVLQIYFENYNDAIDAWFGRHDSGATARRIHEKMIAEQPKGLDSESDKLSRRLVSQQKSLEKFDKEIDENRKKGLAIQENSEQIDYLISQVNQMVLEAGWNSFSTTALELEYISKIDAKDKKILLVLPNNNGNVWINIETSSQQNAQIYFAKAKKVREKSEGARDALIDTERLLKKAKKTEVKRKEKEHVTTIKRAKRLEVAKEKDKASFLAIRRKCLKKIDDLESLLISNKFPYDIPHEYDNLPRLLGRANVEIKTSKGTINAIIDGYNAPLTAGAFIDLSLKGFYDDLPINRAEEFFILQTGDPKGEEIGYIDPDNNQLRKVPLEIRTPSSINTLYGQTFEEVGLYTETPTLPFATLGTLGWAHSDSDLNDGSSQFFFFLYEAELNPAGRNLIDGRNAAFGYVVDGSEILNKLGVDDKIIAIKVLDGSDNLKAKA